MDSILIQILNGLDKGAAYALIALGLTLVFGTLGIVNFAHGAIFMLGAFCAVTFKKLLTLSVKVKDESVTMFAAYKEEPYLKIWFGDTGEATKASIFLQPPFIQLGVAAVQRLQIPAGGKNLFTATGQDSNPEVVIFAQKGEGFAEQSTGRHVDGVDLAPVERDFKNVPAADDFDLFG